MTTRLAALAAVLMLCGCGGGGDTPAPPPAAVATAAAPASPAAPAAAPAPAADPATSNLRADNMAKWRTARAAVIAGTTRAGIACLGDSTTLGIGANGQQTDVHKNSWPSQMIATLVAAKLPANGASFFGDGGLLDQIYTADPRLSEIVSGGHDWLATDHASVGGLALGNLRSTTPLVFTPTETFDTIDVYDFPLAAGSPFAVDTGSNATRLDVATAAVPGGVRKNTAHPTAGIHAINIAATQNGVPFAGVVLLAVDAYNSAVKDVAVWNLGWSGSTTGDWAGTLKPPSSLTVLGQLAPKLTVIDLGINDGMAAVDPETSRANLRTIITAARASGDVILVIPNRVDPSRVSDSRQDAEAQVVRDLSKEFDVPLYDVPAAVGTYSAATAAGYMYDTLHLTAAGNAVIAKGIAAIVTAN